MAGVALLDHGAVVLVPLGPADPALLGESGVTGGVHPGPRPAVLIGAVDGELDDGGPAHLLGDPYGGAPDGAVDAAAVGWAAAERWTTAAGVPVLAVWIGADLAGWLAIGPAEVLGAHVWVAPGRDEMVPPVGDPDRLARWTGLPAGPLRELHRPLAGDDGDAAVDRAEALLGLLGLPAGTFDRRRWALADSAGLVLRPLRRRRRWWSR